MGLLDEFVMARIHGWGVAFERPPGGDKICRTHHDPGLFDYKPPCALPGVKSLLLKKFAFDASIGLARHTVVHDDALSRVPFSRRNG